MERIDCQRDFVKLNLASVTTFYAVWTRQQENTSDPGRLALGRDVRRMWSAPGDDVFLVKMAYGIGR